MKSTLLTLALLAVSFLAQAQYQFASKSAEKLYKKIEDAYWNYDFDFILDNEDKIEEYYGPARDTLTRNMYLSLGESYFDRSNYEKALAYNEKALRVLEEMENSQYEDLKEVLFSVASCKVELGQLKGAEDIFLKIVKGDKELYGSSDPTYLESELYFLSFYDRTGQGRKGVQHAEEIRRSFRGNTLEVAEYLKQYGGLLEADGQYTKAERTLKRSLNLFEEIGLEASTEYVATLSALGIFYTNIGKLPQAEELYLNALDILRRIQGENEDFVASINSNLAQLYFELGNYEEAEKTYTKLLADDLEYFGDESAYYGYTAYNLGKNQLYAQKYSDARKYFDLANTVFSKALEENSPEIAYLLNLQIRLNIGLGDPDRALEFGEQAFKMYPKVFGEDHFETAYPHFNIGNAHMALDDLDKATEHHLRALAIREKALRKSHPLYAESTRQLAILEWKKGNNSAALDYFQKTFDNYYLQINNYFPILNEEQKTKFYYNKLRPTVEQFNAFVVKAAPDDRSLQGKMYDYQLTLKGIILSATTKVKQAILTSGDSVLIGKYETWLGQKENLAQLFSDSEMEETLRNKRIDSLTTSSANLEKELSKLSAGFASTIESKQPSWTDIRSKLKIGEAAVEMVRFRDFATDSAGIFTDEVYYAALIVKHDSEYPDMVLIRNGQQMETRFLANYRNSIKYKIVESKSYNLYWKPIANRLAGVKKVYFSPDGVYNQISINTLNNSESQDFNLDEFEIRQMNNTRDLLTLGSKSTSTGKSVFFGYPNYNLGSVEEGMKKEGNTEAVAERGGRGGSKGKELDLTKVSIPRGLRGNMLRYMRSNSLLVLLPGTKKEIELIDSLYENASIERDVFLSNEAIEEEIKSLDNPKALHIATHGFFLENTGEPVGKTDGYVENPLLRAGLILAGANSFIRSGEISANLDLNDDGILTAYEAMNLPLDNTEIVVLSACETGLGEVKNGEGVFGLQRAFQVAGADAIIMSMWTVDDAATQELMTIFYEDWLKTGDKHLAFRSAQLRLKKKWKSPYYWGAFVMVGN